MAKVDEQTWQLVSWPEAQTWEPKVRLPRRLGFKTERAHTFLALTHTRRTALRISDFQLNRDRYVIFSDTHKGDRSRGSDEFQINDDLYCHALEHYLNGDYRLVLNGDIEEGWKSPYEDIIAAYEDTAFAWERAFAQQGEGHYLRIWGNHDLDWRDPRKVDRYLRPALGRRVQVHGGVLLGDRILIAHGHQGEFNSDRLAWLSRRAIRHVWRPVQRALNFAPRTTARNNNMDHPRDKHLSAWARAFRMLLIAGHTHSPVMAALDRITQGSAPYYLNDGCCVHKRSITGIEIDQGELRLIKWEAIAQAAGQPAAFLRTVFQRADLGAYLAQL